MRIGAWLKIKQDEANVRALKARLIVPNPEYLSRQRMGFPTDGIRRFDPLWMEVGNELWVPRGIVEQFQGSHYTIEDETVLADKPVEMKSLMTLRPEQVPAVETMVNGFLNEGWYGGILQAPAGSGKTVMSLAIAAQLRVPTIVLVHKEFLVEQWMARIAEFLEVPQVGIIQQDRCEYGPDYPISIAMVQSLLARQYPEEMFRYFSLVIVDEVHRFGAVEFRKAITMFPARYRLGVTATPKRQDGLERVFFSHIGPIRYVSKVQRLTPTVHMIKSAAKIATEKPFKDWRGKVNLVQVVNYLCEDEARNMQIVRLIVKAVETGRKVILLSDRREHLVTLKAMLDRHMIKTGERFTIGFYVGGMTPEERAVSETRQVILATFQMAQEALDIPDLDTLILATPHTEIEQAVGRILRVREGKKSPVVIDLVDDISICHGMARKRSQEYRRLGYELAR